MSCNQLVVSVVFYHALSCDSIDSEFALIRTKEGAIVSWPHVTSCIICSCQVGSRLSSARVSYFCLLHQCFSLGLLWAALPTETATIAITRAPSNTRAASLDGVFNINNHVYSTWQSTTWLGSSPHRSLSSMAVPVTRLRCTARRIEASITPWPVCLSDLYVAVYVVGYIYGMVWCTGVTGRCF